jgi:ElaB/YqjD/DUF883 family membrane-anchored ribosome-binding protein
MKTPEQRLDRAERILVQMAQSGRRSRSEFRYKINSLIDAQMRHEARWDAESQVINEKMKELIQTQKETSEQMKRQAARADQETADLKKSLKAFIDNLRKGHNGNS